MITFIVHVTSIHVICNVLNYLIKIKIIFFRETKFFWTCEENSLRVVENLNHQKIFHISCRVRCGSTQHDRSALSLWTFIGHAGSFYNISHVTQKMRVFRMMHNLSCGLFESHNFSRFQGRIKNSYLLQRWHTMNVTTQYY